MNQPRIELLYFDGCPHYEQTRELVERLARELQITPSIELVTVSDPDAAITRRFLGSPTVRIEGRDVEPGADERREFVLACRVYQTDRGPAGQPDETWIRTALERTR
jgi:hypothetical protein